MITDKNIHKYIKDIPDNFHSLCPAHQADFVRVSVICNYGGLWLDSDTIVLDKLDSLFEIIDKKDGFFIKENNRYYCNGVFGSKSNTQLMLQWKNKIYDIVFKKSNLKWSELGSVILNKLSVDYMGDYEIFNGLDNMYPVNWPDCVKHFIDMPYDNYKNILRDYQPILILVNSVYKKLDDKTEKEILEGNMPINYFINKSYCNIPISINKYASNFGDCISDILFSYLSDHNLKTVPLLNDNTSYLTTGSHLRLCTENQIIIGSGFISDNDDLGKGDWNKYTNMVYKVPKKILSVRGKLTRDKLVKMGIECPEKYGDPLILFPLLYNPVVNIKKKIGIIPHYVDKNSSLLKKLILKLEKNNMSYKIININTDENYNKFIENIKSCEYIISSSLHGIIMGIVYFKKVLYMEFSDKVIGGMFKFNDFFSSLDIKYIKSTDDILKNYIVVNKDNLCKLGKDILDTLPFVSNYKKDKLKILWNEYVNFEG